jgi:hypothetical protein
MENPDIENVLASSPNLLAESEPGRQVRNLLTTDVMAIRELPDNLDEIDKLRSAIDAKLFHDFTSTRLSDLERVALMNGHEDFRSVRSKWDGYILEVAQQYGARLLLSTLVMQRVWSWQCGEKDGARKIKTLFHEMHRSALIGLKKAKGRINSRHRAAKPLWIREITALQMQLRESFPKTPDAVRQFIDDVIEASPGSFPNLKSNKASLQLFLDDHRALAFRGFDFKRVKGDLTPTKFYAEWVAAAENHRSPELVRQYLSTR